MRSNLQEASPMVKPSLMIGVGAVIKDKDDRILLVKHIPERGGFWQGKWICPGGELEAGETIEEGIKREVREETQLEIDLLTPLPPFESIFKNEKGTLHVIYIDYLARVIRGELKAKSDIGEAIWVKRELIPRMQDTLHKDTWRLLQIAKIIDANN